MPDVQLPVVSVPVRVRWEKFLYELKAGPAGGD